MTSTWQKVAAENLIRNVSGTYYLNAKVGGKKIRRSLDTDRLAVAKLRRDDQLSKLRAMAPRAASSIKTLGDALNVVEARETTKPHLKPRSVQYYREVFASIRKSIDTRRAITAISADDMALWWAGYGMSATQANNALRLVRMAFEEARKASLRFDNPTAEIRRRKTKASAIETLPSRKQFEAMISDIRAVRPKNAKPADMAEFMAWSGLRKGEAQALEWHHVGKDWLTVTGGEQGTKNGDSRLVPINRRLLAVIERMRPPNAAGKVFLVASPREALDAAARRGHPKMRVHDLRHLFATECIEAGIDIPTVAKWLGHKDRGILAMKTYGHLRDDHSLAQAKKLG